VHWNGAPGRPVYRPTVTPEGSTHVDTAFTGTTSSILRTASGNVAVAAVVRQRVFAEAPAMVLWAINDGGRSAAGRPIGTAGGTGAHAARP
jgi:Flp pilus assembly CpaF family ATPase